MSTDFTKLSVFIDIVETWLGIADGQKSSVFSFQDDTLSKYQWIYTKLCVFIDIVETWFGIADGQISSVFEYHQHAFVEK